MAKSASNDIARLRKRDGDACHYCFIVPPRRQMTRDHVYPKSFGGANNVNNYVLACADCNGERGTSLFFCRCLKCSKIVKSYLNHPATVGKAFDSMMRANRPRIKKNPNSPTGAWFLSTSISTKQFPSFQAAVDYLVTNGYSIIEEPVNS